MILIVTCSTKRSCLRDFDGSFFCSDITTGRHDMCATETVGGTIIYPSSDCCNFSHNSTEVSRARRTDGNRRFTSSFVRDTRDGLATMARTVFNGRGQGSVTAAVVVVSGGGDGHFQYDDASDRRGFLITAVPGGLDFIINRVVVSFVFRPAYAMAAAAGAVSSVVVLDRGNNTTCTINMHGKCGEHYGFIHAF